MVKWGGWVIHPPPSLLIQAEPARMEPWEPDGNYPAGTLRHCRSLVCGSAAGRGVSLPWLRLPEIRAHTGFGLGAWSRLYPR